MPARAATYLDANAGSPLKPQVLEALQSLFGSTSGISGAVASPLLPNASSIHSHGRKAKRWMAEARESVANSFGSDVDPEQLVFTSSGTEANQLAVRSAFEASRSGFHWITTSVEHDSNLQLVDWVRAQGGRVDLIPVNSEGVPELSALESLWRPETGLLSIVWVNNETGVVSPVEAFVAAARARGVRAHVDAAQAWGKLPLSLNELGASYVTFSAHKIGALAGTGVLWVGRGSPVNAVVRGKQEKGRRGGTENLLGIVAAGAAARCLEPVAWSTRVAALRDELQNDICQRIPGTRVNGRDSTRVANTLNLNFEGVSGDGLVMALDLAGYSVSSGSACSSGALEPSHVLLAMGRSRDEARSAVRISLPDVVELTGFVDTLEATVKRIRSATAPGPGAAARL